MEIPAGWHKVYVYTRLDTGDIIEALDDIRGKDTFYLKVGIWARLFKIKVKGREIEDEGWLIVTETPLTDADGTSEVTPLFASFQTASRSRNQVTTHWGPALSVPSTGGPVGAQDWCHCAPHLVEHALSLKKKSRSLTCEPACCFTCLGNLCHLCLTPEVDRFRPRFALAISPAVSTMAQPTSPGSRSIFNTVEVPVDWHKVYVYTKLDTHNMFDTLEQICGEGHFQVKATGRDEWLIVTERPLADALIQVLVLSVS
ncbi:hypothetical protein B0T21DRAFT_353636 [Apiosordaria backusii]|uniref:Uncharacterized protein n=1 Tax=Apiosordaria backusii TaxID=314023 RepID=A0AA40DFH2_9PEZI|nr:hypothetical protein B0T21DRAFT_353636 [Apiosordaria backusii]